PSFFLFYCSRALLDVLSLPTRRSSDLGGFHAATKNGYFTSGLNGRLNDLLESVNIGCKCRKNQPTIYTTKNILDIFSDDFFGKCKASDFTICAIGKQAEYTFFTDFSHFCNIRRFTNRCEIKFKVSRMDDVSWRCFYDDSISVWNTMCHTEKTYRSFTEFNDVMFLNGI